jgi:hypothetical protein
VGGNLTLTSGNASGITDRGTVTVGGNLAATTDANSGVINMDTLAVDGTVALTTNGSGNATVVNDAGLNFAASTIGGNLAATVTTGNMTDSGALAITGTTTLTTSANNATIALDQTTNAFTGAVTVTTNDDSGTDADVTIDGGTTALILAASTIDGDLTVTSDSASGITDRGTVTVGGDLSATTDANSGVINLGTLAVDGTVQLTTDGSGNATVVNDAGFTLADSIVGGKLSATATTGDLLFGGSVIAGMSQGNDGTYSRSDDETTNTTSGDIDLEATGGSILNSWKKSAGSISEGFSRNRYRAGKRVGRRISGTNKWLHLEGETITLTAANKIGTKTNLLKLDAQTLNASTTSSNSGSDIYIRDSSRKSRGLTLATISTENGDIYIDADGWVRREDVSNDGVADITVGTTDDLSTPLVNEANSITIIDRASLAYGAWLARIAAVRDNAESIPSSDSVGTEGSASEASALVEESSEESEESAEQPSGEGG